MVALLRYRNILTLDRHVRYQIVVTGRETMLDREILRLEMARLYHFGCSVMMAKNFSLSSKQDMFIFCEY
jgi:hypothetical protein